jgi:hypothetical protein
MRRSFLPLFVAASIAGCGMPPPQPAPKSATASQDQNADQAEPEGAAKYSPMARAKAVEGDVMDAKQKQDQDIEKGAN